MSQETALTKLDVPGSPENRRLGRYVLRYQVAQGGMATVYLAQMAGPQGFGKWVAIKWIHPHLAQEERFVSMFLDEARVTAQVHHPNVCQVVDFVNEGGASYIVMEYLHGESFSMVTRRGFEASPGFPVRLALRIVADSARGLHAAHDAHGHDGEPLGIVHRDVSPQNIHVLYDGATKMLDFGVARARGRVTQTETGEVKGKLAYMSPEQIRRGEIDRRADVWSLGVVLWESLTGRRLFRGESEGMTLQRVLEGEIPAPSELRPSAEISDELDRVAMKALSRDPETRYQTAGELADELERVLHALKTPTGQSQVADWMSENFRDKRAVRDQLLRAKFENAAGILAVDLESGSHIAPRTVPAPVGSAAAEPVALGQPVWQRGAALGLAAVGLMIVGAGVSRWLGPVPDTQTAVPDARSAPPEVPDTREQVPDTQVPDAREQVPDTQVPDTQVPDTQVPEQVPDTPEQVPDTRDDEREARDRPSKRAVAAPGMLNLLGLPPAEVYYRGERIGRTPLVNRSLPAGRQRLELRWPDGESRALSVEIRSGETTRETVRR